MSTGQRVSKGRKTGTIVETRTVEVRMNAAGDTETRVSALVKMDGAKRAGWYWLADLKAA